ncbi:MAG TPA: uroporphyrinogen-III C-methyltransferase [Acidobacteriaceae bacterium]
MPLEDKSASRIGICGSASVGKTTLAHEVSRRLQLPCIGEEMRAHLESSGSSLAEQAPADTEAALLKMWQERVQAEASATGFIADNCPLDFAAYALYYGCLSEQSYDTLIHAAVEAVQRYDAVVLLPWGVLPYEQDGIRPADRFLQLRYQTLLEGLLRRYVSAEKLYFLPESLLRVGDRAAWVEALAAKMRTPREERPGTVYLVGAGPGDPRLLTLRAKELLGRADVIAYDLLISPEMLAEMPQGAELLPVGRRFGMGPTSYQLHPEVLERAQQGKTVVRLKSGDPLLFGRGGEEAEALAQAGIPFEFVPGVTAALGAASYAGIPLTHRGLTSQVLIGTGHEAGEPEERAGHPQRLTVLYMAARRLQENLEYLHGEGYTAETPAALIASATTPRQKVFLGTVGTLPEQAANIPEHVPVILFAGSSVALHERLQWFVPAAPETSKA